MKEAIHYMVCVVAASLVINDLSATPRWSATTPQIDVNVNQTITALKNGIDFKQDAFANAPPEVREIIRGYQNGQGVLPTSPEAALKDGSCRQLDYGESYLHDFNDRVAELCNQSPESRANCYLDALKEYLGGLPRGTVLNVDGEHNLKIVCDDGREYVFDKDGKIIPDGINEGTFNISNPENWASHTLNDIIAAIKRLPNKSSMTKDECVKLLKDYQEREVKAKERAKALFSGRDNFSIDTSRLEALFKEGISFLKDLIAKGERATNSQIDAHNQRVKEMFAETVNVAKRIDALNVSDEEKKNVAEKAFERVNGLKSQFDSLSEQAKSMGLVHEATSKQKMELIKDVQEELSEASRDAGKANSSSNTTAAPRGRTLTDEEAIRLLREDDSGIKAVSNALKD